MDSPPDKIYLQWWPDPTEPEPPGEVTWCVDEINDTDAEYLLATPERLAAGEMREALENIVNEIGPDIGHDFGCFNETGGYIAQARTVLEKVRDEHNVS